MTIKEAIKILKCEEPTVDEIDARCRYNEALDMAIKALEQKSVLDKIRAEIKAIAINGQLDEHTMFMRAEEQVKQMTPEIIDKYRAKREG